MIIKYKDRCHLNEIQKDGRTGTTQDEYYY